MIIKLIFFVIIYKHSHKFVMKKSTTKIKIKRIKKNYNLKNILYIRNQYQYNLKNKNILYKTKI